MPIGSGTTSVVAALSVAVVVGGRALVGAGVPLGVLPPLAAPAGVCRLLDRVRRVFARLLPEVPVLRPIQPVRAVVGVLGCLGRSHMPNRFALRVVAVLTIALAAVVGAAGVASAHAKLESMTPADGSSMAAPPTKVVLTFTEPVGPNGTQVLVKSPTGKNVANGAAQIADNTVTQPVGAMIEAGRYTVEARVVSDDGHPIEVSGSFTVTHIGHPATEPAGAPAQAQGNSNVVTIVAMCLVMLVVVALAVVIVRRRPAA
ncbi:copper resistance CopC family protein [Kribbella sp. NPDC048915]|uniref:copper resistance CopC family protein n=1 Tax=Kribbella sp. NPDC048915 TaxID=3155148 RepID=UPI0033D72390